MDPEQFKKIEAIFHEVVGLSPSEQEARLIQLCDGDDVLATEVRNLITHSGDDLGDRVDQIVTSASDLLQDESLEHTQVGAYQVADKIGEGGMGEVYAAKQTHPLEREVALKVIRSDRVSPRMLARFRAELSNLSLMQHDAIAQVYDAGETPDGRPFFVMERVSGTSIVQFCEQERLSVLERIRIFLTVCSAVHHAHQRGVIHRDLKPSNILVSRDENRMVVKVIDFGIAKAVTADPELAEYQTVAGQVLGSLEYMSPEQANSQGLDVDVRTDVYALGAVLYELLTGFTPLVLDYTNGQLQLLQSITNEQPLRLSQRLRVERSPESEQKAKEVRGDLDWIVDKSLSKRRADRYGSVADFSSDLNGYLHNQPVSAHPPSTWYQFNKFVRRHPTGVAVSVVSVVLLLGGFIGTLWGLQAAQQAEELAERRAASSEQAVTYLLDMFSNANPEFHQGKRVTVDELITSAAADSETMFAQEPHLRVEMQYRLAEVMSRMGNYQGAIALANQALELDQASGSYPSTATFQGIETLTRTYMSQSRFAEALALLDGLEPELHLLPADIQDIARARVTYARAAASFYISGSKLTGFGLLEHDQSEPLQLAREAVVLFRQAAPVSLELADALDLVGYNLTYTPLNDEAFAPLIESLNIREELVGTHHTSLVRTLEHLSDAYISAGQYDEALPHVMRMREISESAHPPESPLHYQGYGQHATFLSESGQFAEAVEMWKNIVARRNDGSGNYYHLISYQYLISGLMALGRLDEALGYLNEASELTHASEIEWGLARIYFGYANLAALKNQPDEVLRYLEIAIELASDDYGLENQEMFAGMRDMPEFQALVRRHKDNVRNGISMSSGEHNLKYHAQ